MYKTTIPLLRTINTTLQSTQSRYISHQFSTPSLFQPSKHTSQFQSTLIPKRSIIYKQNQIRHHQKQHFSTIQAESTSKTTSTTSSTTTHSSQPIISTTTQQQTPITNTVNHNTMATTTTTTEMHQQIQPDLPSTPILPTTFPRFTSFHEWFQWYLIDPPTYQRFSQGWWASHSWLMLMYSVTGYSALLLVRNLLSLFGIENTGLFKGEPQHRVLYFMLMTPMYSFLTLIYGRIFGRPVYTKQMVRRIWGRFFPWLKNKKETK